ncbi:hypothetical protein CsatB_028001 [Cannabis sativa]
MIINCAEILPSLLSPYHENSYNQSKQLAKMSLCLKYSDLDEWLLDPKLWVKPSIGMVKINVDGALFAAERAYEAGIVARNTDGHLVEAFAIYRYGEVQPFEAKVMSLKEEALSWIKSKHCHS